jgi:V/A-type H+/Na+-transporting ATPase subunit K
MEKGKAMKRIGLGLVVAGLVMMCLAIPGSVAAQTGGGTGSADYKPIGIGLIAIGAGIAIGIAGMATGRAQAEIGAAAVGAVAEDPNLFGKSLILTVIPETIVIFGLVVALILLFVTIGQV